LSGSKIPLNLPRIRYGASSLLKGEENINPFFSTLLWWVSKGARSIPLVKGGVKCPAYDKFVTSR
jgi:hypothetical protein